jgi:transcription initiation factor TFIIIB Brf1 subunit/transcription initiation factor TFIIB
MTYSHSKKSYLSAIGITQKEIQQFRKNVMTEDKISIFLRSKSEVVEMFLNEFDIPHTKENKMKMTILLEGFSARQEMIKEIQGKKQ